MREILFRGKRKDTGEWVEGHLHKMDGYGTGYTEYGIQVQVISTSRPWSVLVLPETVGQYIGLTANGKKIFEGDIISFKEEVAEYDYQNPILNFDTGRFRLPEIRKKENRVGVVKWCGDLLQYRVFFNRNCGTSRYELGDHRLEELLVIGNVHDNPELLKGESK